MGLQICKLLFDSFNDFFKSSVVGTLPMVKWLKVQKKGEIVKLLLQRVMFV